MAFPILNIANTTLFSDIIGPRRQGIEQGLLQMSGSIARLFGPIVIRFKKVKSILEQPYFYSLLYSLHGPKLAWKMEILVISLTLILWFIYYKRITPLVKISDKKIIHNINVADVTPDPTALSLGSFMLSTISDQHT